MRTSLRKNEKILLIAHQHWLVLAIPALVVLAAMAASVVWFSTLSWISVGVVCLPILNFLWWFLVRKYNLWVITDQRIIDEYGVLTTNSKESLLDKINNVGYHQSLLGRIFDYGNISIQTAAEMGATVYDNLAHPKLVRQTITQACGNYVRSSFHEEGEAFADALNEKGSRSSQPDFAKEMERLYRLKTEGILSEEEYHERKEKLMKN